MDGHQIETSSDGATVDVSDSVAIDKAAIDKTAVVLFPETVGEDSNNHLLLGEMSEKLPADVDHAVNTMSILFNEDDEDDQSQFEGFISSECSVKSDISTMDEIKNSQLPANANELSAFGGTIDSVTDSAIQEIPSVLNCGEPGEAEILTEIPLVLTVKSEPETPEKSMCEGLLPGDSLLGLPIKFNVGQAALEKKTPAWSNLSDKQDLNSSSTFPNPTRLTAKKVETTDSDTDTSDSSFHPKIVSVMSGGISIDVNKSSGNGVILKRKLDNTFLETTRVENEKIQKFDLDNSSSRMIEISEKNPISNTKSMGSVRICSKISLLPFVKLQKLPHVISKGHTFKITEFKATKSAEDSSHLGINVKQKNQTGVKKILKSSTEMKNIVARVDKTMTKTVFAGAGFVRKTVANVCDPAGMKVKQIHKYGHGRRKVLASDKDLQRIRAGTETVFNAQNIMMKPAVSSQCIASSIVKKMEDGNAYTTASSFGSITGSKPQTHTPISTGKLAGKSPMYGLLKGADGSSKIVAIDPSLPLLLAPGPKSFFDSAPTKHSILTGAGNKRVIVPQISHKKYTPIMGKPSQSKSLNPEEMFEELWVCDVSCQTDSVPVPPPPQVVYIPVPQPMAKPVVTPVATHHNNTPCPGCKKAFKTAIELRRNALRAARTQNARLQQRYDDARAQLRQLGPELGTEKQLLNVARPMLTDGQMELLSLMASSSLNKSFCSRRYTPFIRNLAVQIQEASPFVYRLLKPLLCLPSQMIVNGYIHNPNGKGMLTENYAEGESMLDSIMREIGRGDEGTSYLEGLD